MVYYSHKIIAAEYNYKVHDSELLAIIIVFKKWRHYLNSSYYSIIVLTACNNSNLYVVQAGNLRAVDGRWLSRLLVVAALRANQVTSQTAGVVE